MGIEVAGAGRRPASAIRRERIGPGTANFTRGPGHDPRPRRPRRSSAASASRPSWRPRASTLIGIGRDGHRQQHRRQRADRAPCWRCRPARWSAGAPGVDDDGPAPQDRGRSSGRWRSTAPTPADPLDVLAKVGGFEIAGLCGRGAGRGGRPGAGGVDGFIASAAALAAARRAPNVTGFLIAGHRSVEPGHRRVLEALGLRPLLDLEHAPGRGHRRGAGHGAGRRRGPHPGRDGHLRLGAA